MESILIFCSKFKNDEIKIIGLIDEKKIFLEKNFKKNNPFKDIDFMIDCKLKFIIEILEKCKELKYKKIRIGLEDVFLIRNLNDISNKKKILRRYDKYYKESMINLFEKLEKNEFEKIIFERKNSKQRNLIKV